MKRNKGKTALIFILGIGSPILFIIVAAMSLLIFYAIYIRQKNYREINVVTMDDEVFMEEVKESVDNFKSLKLFVKNNDIDEIRNAFNNIRKKYGKFYDEMIKNKEGEFDRKKYGEMKEYINKHPILSSENGIKKVINLIKIQEDEENGDMIDNYREFL